MKPTPSKSRILRSTLRFLILGFIINVAVTWCIAAWGVHPRDRVTKLTSLLLSGDESALQIDWTRFFKEISVDIKDIQAWPGRVPDYWPQICSCAANKNLCPRGHRLCCHDWIYEDVFVHGYKPDGSDIFFSYDTNRLGWPLVSWRYQELYIKTYISVSASSRDGDILAPTPDQIIDVTIPPQQPTAAGLDVGIPLKTFFPSSTRILPIRPLFPATIFNTLFYAAAVVLFGLPIRALVHSRRRRRGLCPNCRYPVNNLPICPECGCSTPKANSTPTAHAQSHH